MIIAVDFDGTLQLRDGSPNLPLIKWLTSEQRRGAILILWTCREGPSLHEAVAWLRQHNFRVDYINCNCPEGIARLGHNSRKIFADLYIDDKAIK